MTDDERKAVEWLENWEQHGVRMQADWKHARTIKAMLARPVMPEEPTPEMVSLIRENIQSCVGWNVGSVRAYRALYAHLTRPKTKEVEVWAIVAGLHVVCSSPNEGDMQSLADAWNAMPGHQGQYQVVKLTARQTMPA